MTRNELIEQLEELINQAMAHDETRPAAAVLNVLRGALLARADTELMNFCCAFSKEQIQRLDNSLGRHRN